MYTSFDELHIPVGTSYTRNITIYTDDTQSEVEDLTGGTVTFTLYDAPHGTLVYEGETVIEDPTTGEAAGVFDAEDTELDGKYHVLYCEAVYTDANGNRYVVDQLKVFLE